MSREDWFVRAVGASTIIASVALAVIAVCLVVVVWHLPEMLEMGWSAIESMDSHSESLDQLRGAL